MQIKPHFSEYEELKRTPLLKDDRGVQYSLVHFKAVRIEKPGHHYELSQYKNPDTDETSKNEFRALTVRHEYEGYAVLSDKMDKYSNGATAYDDTLYWSKPKKLEKFEIDGLEIYEKMTGQNSLFSGEFPTMNTQFWVFPYNRNL